MKLEEKSVFFVSKQIEKAIDLFLANYNLNFVDLYSIILNIISYLKLKEILND